MSNKDCLTIYDAKLKLCQLYNERRLDKKNRKAEIRRIASSLVESAIAAGDVDKLDSIFRLALGSLIPMEFYIELIVNDQQLHQLSNKQINVIISQLGQTVLMFSRYNLSEDELLSIVKWMFAVLKLSKTNDQSTIERIYRFFSILKSHCCKHHCIKIAGKLHEAVAIFRSAELPKLPENLLTLIHEVCSTNENATACSTNLQNKMVHPVLGSLAYIFSICRLSAQAQSIADTLVWCHNAFNIPIMTLLDDFLTCTFLIQLSTRRYYRDILAAYICLKLPTVFKILIEHYEFITRAQLQQCVDNLNRREWIRVALNANKMQEVVTIERFTYQICEVGLLENSNISETVQHTIPSGDNSPTSTCAKSSDIDKIIKGSKNMGSLEKAFTTNTPQLDSLWRMITAGANVFDIIFVANLATCKLKYLASRFIFFNEFYSSSQAQATTLDKNIRAWTFDLTFMMTVRLHTQFDGLIKQLINKVDDDGDGDPDIQVDANAFLVRWCAFTAHLGSSVIDQVDETQPIEFLQNLMQEQLPYNLETVNWSHYCRLMPGIATLLLKRIHPGPEHGSNSSIDMATLTKLFNTMRQHVHCLFIALLEYICKMKLEEKSLLYNSRQILLSKIAMYLERDQMPSAFADGQDNNYKYCWKCAHDVAKSLLEDCNLSNEPPFNYAERLQFIDVPPTHHLLNDSDVTAILDFCSEIYAVRPGVPLFMRRHPHARKALLEGVVDQLLDASSTFYPVVVRDTGVLFESLAMFAPTEAVCILSEKLKDQLSTNSNASVPCRRTLIQCYETAILAAIQNGDVSVFSCLRKNADMSGFMSQITRAVIDKLIEIAKSVNKKCPWKYELTDLLRVFAKEEIKTQ